jgi:formylglycine-generating enzyme required for sulfatase activity
MLTGCTYRLPTVAEWEHCCRGRPGDEIAVGSEDAASRGAMAGSVETGNRIVGLEPPNGLGLSDMLGNVWEWCADIGSGAAYRKAKGGGRKGASLRHTEEFDVSAGELFIGFRIVREIPADVATPGLATLRA